MQFYLYYEFIKIIQNLYVFYNDQLDFLFSKEFYLRIHIKFKQDFFKKLIKKNFYHFQNMLS